MPFITVSLFKGRTREQKQMVAKAITDAFVIHAGSNKDDVQVVFQEVEPADWARGGKLYDPPPQPSGTPKP
jgi:4-oxalocrotonate tautomerase